jgi:hypothetical protein
MHPVRERRRGSPMYMSFRINMVLDLDFKNQLVISSRHGPVKYGMIGLIQEIINLELQGKVHTFQTEGAPRRDVIHEIGIEPVPTAYIVAGGGISFAVGIELVGKKEIAPPKLRHHVPRVKRNIYQLLSIRFITPD